MTTTTRPNLIAAAIERMRERIEQGVKPDGSPITGDLGKLDAELAITGLEHFAYQTAQARAHALGKLSTGEAQTIYIALNGEAPGPNGGWAASADLATKVIVTQVIGELMVRR